MARIGEEDVKLVNCCVCERELMGESMKEHMDNIDPMLKERWPLVQSRVDGRPYCHLCFRALELYRKTCGRHYPSGRDPHRAGRLVPTISAALENGIRHMEGD